MMDMCIFTEQRKYRVKKRGWKIVRKNQLTYERKMWHFGKVVCVYVCVWMNMKHAVCFVGRNIYADIHGTIKCGTIITYDMQIKIW